MNHYMWVSSVETDEGKNLFPAAGVHSTRTAGVNYLTEGYSHLLSDKGWVITLDGSTRNEVRGMVFWVRKALVV